MFGLALVVGGQSPIASASNPATVPANGSIPNGTHTSSAQTPASEISTDRTATSSAGSLRLRVRGDYLNKAVTIGIVGTRGAAKGTTRSVKVTGRKKIQGLAPGRYRINAKPVKKKRAVALVTKTKPKFATVSSGSTTTTRITYKRWWSNSNTIAYAPLAHPERLVVRGRVSSQRAWSTSKVLVVFAYLKNVVDADPRRLSSYWRKQIKKALTASDFNALLRIRGAIPGGSGAPMTAILRSIGDTTTTAPNRSEGSMNWSVRNQIRFMAALNDGQVVSKRASRWVLNRMHPIKAHSWGLGKIGASAYKGGWLRPSTETRQMGIVGKYAVAIITDGVGPARYQTDGDWAHERQMNRLARVLNKHLRAKK